jgi:hypothetical protein
VWKSPRIKPGSDEFLHYRHEQKVFPSRMPGIVGSAGHRECAGLIRVLLVVPVLACTAGFHAARVDGARSLMALVCEGGSDLQPLRERVATYAADGRASLVDLYRAQCDLRGKPGWVLDELFREEITVPGGERLALPSNSLRTARKGPALWILTGIHGEEPAGPNALAENLAAVAALNKKGVPMVVMPLLNPLGYQRNWRYPNAVAYSERNPGTSVGDSDHLLPTEQGRPRQPAPACRQADLLTARVMELARDYPPVLSLDLHEDNLLSQGYVYSQGARGAEDPVAEAIVELFRRHQFPILEDGKTRFGETVRHGIVSVVKDGSIDELLSAPTVLVKGAWRPGPGGRSVLVLETSSMNTALPDRKKAHATILASLESLWQRAKAARGSRLFGAGD